MERVPVNYEGIPQCMKQVPQWICWCYEKRDGKMTKVPKNVRTGYNGSSTNPETWVTFEEAKSAYETGRYSGMGFVFAGDRAFSGVDLDHVVENGKLDERYLWILDEAKTYCELSPSGTGLHIIFFGSIPSDKGCRTPMGTCDSNDVAHEIEMYDQGRYFTVTGNVYGEAKPVCENKELLRKLHDTYFKKDEPKSESAKAPLPKNVLTLSDSELIDRMYTSKSGDKIRALMDGDLSAYENDHSRADQALCNYLAFWTQCDAARMDAIFKTSGLMRPKWDEYRGEQTYGQMTIQNAIDDCHDVYEPGSNEGTSFQTVWNARQNTQPEVCDDSKDDFIRNANGQLKITTFNFVRILERHPDLKGRFSYNELSHQKMVELPLPWDKGTGQRAVMDWDYSAFREYCEVNYGIGNKNAIIDAFVNVCMKHRYNPLAEMLDGLVWDGKPRIATMLPKYLGVEDDEYQAEVMRLVMVGAVARAYKPGTKFDYVLVLYGKQGTGKSTFVRMLAPDEDLFTDSLRSFEGKDAVMLISGKWIVELAEMTALTTSRSIEGAKAYLTFQVDEIRAPYGREIERRPRTCVFIGTTNRMEYLSDQSGDRRFLPVISNLEFEHPTEALISKDAPEDIKQCWAEAVHIWKTEKPALVLPHHLQKVADEMREAHRAPLPFEGELEAWLDKKWEQVKGDEFEGNKSERVCSNLLYKEAIDVLDRAYGSKKDIVNQITQYMDERSDWKRMKGRQRVEGIDGCHPCWVPVRDQAGQQTRIKFEASDTNADTQ